MTLLHESWVPRSAGTASLNHSTVRGDIWPTTFFSSNRSGGSTTSTENATDFHKKPSPSLSQLHLLSSATGLTVAPWPAWGKTGGHRGPLGGHRPFGQGRLESFASSSPPCSLGQLDDAGPGDLPRLDGTLDTPKRKQRKYAKV